MDGEARGLNRESRTAMTYSASKIPKATPCGQSPMGTPNAQNTYDNTPVYPSRNYAREVHYVKAALRSRCSETI